MRLLTTINRTYLRVTALALAAAGMLFFLALRQILRAEQNEELAATYRRVVAALEQGAAPVQLPPLLEVRPDATIPDRLVYADTLLADPHDEEGEPFRQISGPALVQGEPYRVTVRVSLLESEDLLLTIGLSMLGLGLLLFSVLWAVNRRQAKELWQPFQYNLDRLRQFTPAQPGSLELMDSGIDEFDELTQALRQLTEKARADYRNLREFTENASHEIQTPLAVMRSKLEWLAQSDLSNDQFATIQEIDRAAGRLSRLNQGLILLAKIENRQFPEAAPVDLRPLLREQVQWLEDFTAAKQIEVALDLSEALPVALPATLAEVLVKNLLENAIRYSPAGSSIHIVVDGRTLTVANPGQSALETPADLFGRFVRRDRTSSQGLGLGLAVVKKIADTYGLEMGYRFEAGKHVFWIIFPTTVSG